MSFLSMMVREQDIYVNDEDVLMIVREQDIYVFLVNDGARTRHLCQ